MLINISMGQLFVIPYNPIKFIQLLCVQILNMFFFVTANLQLTQVGHDKVSGLTTDTTPTEMIIVTSLHPYILTKLRKIMTQNG